MRGASREAQLKTTVFVIVMIVGSAVVTGVMSSPREEPIDAVITVTRNSPTAWRIEYELSRPVEGIDFGPPVDRYRKIGWKVLTPGLTLIEDDGAERLISKGEPFRSVRLEVSLYSAFPPDNYVPTARFSDGGAALFLGFFSGEALTSSGSVELRPRYLVRGVEGEITLAPGGAERGERVFAYFGPQRPIAAGRARLIVDPGAPEWLVHLLERTVAAVTPVYEKRLERRLDAEPLVLIAAGEIDSIDGVSSKGGAINGQIMMTLRGRALSRESKELHHMFTRLIAHELAHLWQESRTGERINNRQPWIHEGGAEALAAAALVESGVWSRDEALDDLRDTEQRCAREKGDASLAEAVADGRWGAVYPCGQMLFASQGKDVFEVWGALIRMTESRNTVYSQALVDEIIDGLD